MYDPTPSPDVASASTADPPPIKLTRDEHGRLTDGRHTYWSDERGNVRWSRLAERSAWRDEGLGIASHGGARTLAGAVSAAHDNERVLIDVRVDLAKQASK